VSSAGRREAAVTGIRLVLGLALVVAAAVGTVEAGVAAEAESPAGSDPGPPRLDLTQRPFVIFAPAPPKPERVKDYPTPDGAADYWGLWEPEAPWQEAASRIDLFAIHSWMVRH
jgi:hypothetical protein